MVMDELGCDLHILRECLNIKIVIMIQIPIQIVVQVPILIQDNL